MIEQTGAAIKFLAFFTESKLGKTGLTVTIDVYDPAGSLIVNGGSATAIGGGLYGYTLASGSVTAEGEYAAIFKTAMTTVDQQHIPALWVIGRAGVEHLDADVSGRASQASLNAVAAYVDTEVVAIKAKTDNLPSDPADASDVAAAFAALPGVAAIADAVWDEALAGHAVSGSAAAALGAAGSASDPLLNAVPGSYESGTAGAALGRIGSALVTTVSPVASSGNVTVHRGDDYKVADNRALEWTGGATWSDLTGASIVMEVDSIEFTGAVVIATGASKKIRVEMTAAQTQELPSGQHAFTIRATKGGNVATLVVGNINVVSRD